MNVCGFRFERGEEGYQVAAYMFNIIAAELLFAFLFAAIVVFTCRRRLGRCSSMGASRRW